MACQSFELYKFKHSTKSMCTCTLIVQSQILYLQGLLLPMHAVYYTCIWPNATETRDHLHHDYAASIQLTQARPQNTLYLD